MIDKYKYTKDISGKIEVSSYGRIRIDGKIKQQLENGRKNLYIKNNENTEIWVHILIANTFCYFNSNNGPFGEVHHIANGYNNMSNNLLWVTKEQHASIHLWMWDKKYWR